MEGAARVEARDGWPCLPPVSRYEWPGRPAAPPRLTSILSVGVLSLQWQREKERNPSNHRPKVRG